MWRQGDVLVEKAEKLPDGLKGKDNIVALGEATGHSHRFQGAEVMVDTKGVQYAVVREQAQLVHEEHKPITFQKGVYRIVRQREFDLVAETTRQVLD